MVCVPVSISNVETTLTIKHTKSQLTASYLKHRLNMVTAALPGCRQAGLGFSLPRKSNSLSEPPPSSGPLFPTFQLFSQPLCHKTLTIAVLLLPKPIFFYLAQVIHSTRARALISRLR